MTYAVDLPAWFGSSRRNTPFTTPGSERGSLVRYARGCCTLWFATHLSPYFAAVTAPPVLGY